LTRRAKARLCVISGISTSASSLRRSASLHARTPSAAAASPLRFAAFVLYVRYGGFAAENEITFRLPQFANLQGQAVLARL
jgi:hypothetical protein